MIAYFKRRYRAPEVILHCRHYGRKIDIFAVGLVLAELFSLRPLLPGSSEIDQINKLMNILGPPSQKTWAEGVNKMKRMNFRLVTPSPGESSQEDLEDSKKAELAIKKTLPRDTPTTVAKLVHLLIGWNPSNRPSADEVLKHEYFHSSKALIDPASEKAGSEPNMKASNQSENYRSRRKQFLHRPNAKEIEPKLRRIRHGHEIDDIVAERRKSAGGNVVPNARTSKERDPQINLSAETSRQPENEFCQYLHAFSNSCAPVGGTRRSSYKSSGNKIRSMFQASSQNPEMEQVSNPFRQNLDSMPTTSTRRSRLAQTITTSANDGMPTPSARRSRLAQATTTGANDVKSARKSARKSTKRRQGRHGHFGRVVEKPRWLLLNQNIGKRAMEVCVSRPVPLGIGEGDDGFDKRHVQTDKRRPDNLSANNPFTCLDSD